MTTPMSEADQFDDCVFKLRDLLEPIKNRDDLFEELRCYFYLQGNRNGAHLLNELQDFLYKEGKCT